MKKIAILPTLLTLGNGICGYVAIAFASKVMPGVRLEAEDAYLATTGWFLILAMVFDVLDGYVARLSRTTSRFGAELDSLCDVVSFGVAPAFLLLKLGPGWEPSIFLHQLVAGISALYLACTILRLARFNAIDSASEPAGAKRFRGLPSPAAAGCVAGLAILRGELPARLVQIFGEEHLTLDGARAGIATTVEIGAPLGALLVALLMVSQFAYPHAASRIVRRRRPVGFLVQVLLVGFILLMFRQVAPALLFWIYALAFPARTLLAGRSLPSPHTDDAAPHSPV